MSRKFMVPIDLGKLELLNARMQNLGSAPSTPVAGQVYYDTALGKFGVFNGSTWDYMGTSTSTGDFSSNTATSVDGEVVVFSGTTGKTGKRATGTGLAKLTSGVLSTAAAGTDYYAPGGTDVAATDGGTGLSSYAVGDILYADTTTSLAKLADIATGNVLLSGGVSTAPSYGKVGLTTHVTGILPGANGGTNNGFMDFTGPTTSLKTFTLPNASATILTSNTAVTVAQGGTGRATSTTAYGLIAAGTTATGAHQTISPGTSGQFLKSAGASALASFAAIAESDVTNLVTDLGLKAPLASPTFTGTVTVPTPTNGTDAANKNYVDNAVQGLSWKQAVVAATTGNVATLAGGAPNTVDGVTLAANDRILVLAQSTASQNGIYTVTTLGTGSNGTWTRSVDADSSTEIDSATVYVEGGSTYADTAWTLTTDNPTLNTTALAFAQINGGTVPVATTSTQGKVELATQAETEAKSDSTLAVTPASLATFARKYTGTIGDNTTTAIAVTHGLGTQYVTAQVYDATSNALVECDVTLTSSTQTTFTFAVAPTTNQYRVVITG